MKLQFGFTLIEAMVTITILGVLAAVGIPQFDKFLARNRLINIAETTYSELLHAQSLAKKRNQNVFINIEHDGAWCYGFSATANCDCKTADSCTVDGSEFVINNEAYDKVTISSELDSANYSAGSIQTFIDSRKQMPDQALQINFTDPTEQSIGVKLTDNGSVYICSNTLERYPDC